MEYTDEELMDLLLMDSLQHSGTPHEGYVPHSGRYPWGSGDNAYQRATSFYSHVKQLEKKGWSQSDIARADGMTMKQLRARMSNAEAEIRRKNVLENRHLAEKGWSRSARARKLGVNESTIREWEKEEVQLRKDQALMTADMLADQVKQYGFVEVGKGIEQHLGVSRTKLEYALQHLEDSGDYRVQDIYLDQNGRGKKQTRMQILCRKDVPIGEVYDNKDKVAIPGKGVYSEDGGDTWTKIEKPVSLDPKRVYVRYTNDDGKTGGVEKDGVILLRKGVEDISLGRAMYAQVRILVGKDKYMKGMAMYAYKDDDIPEGYDIVYCTNKTRAQADKVFKTVAKDKDGNIDWTNPFGATIKTDDEGPDRDLIKCQRHYIDENGKRRQSVLNIVNEEGNWQEWSRSLSAQFLSKQSLDLARRQLKVMYDRKMDEFKEIMGLTNPTIRAQLLEGFADDCDSSAEHLKAAAIAGTASHVIIPITSMREDEVFAPNYEDGSRIVLVRHPFAGNFEAAELKVNNHNRESIAILGKNAPDAIGINHKVAGKLSGADFDGDTVICIPNDSGDIVTMPALKQLEGYEPKVLYAKPAGSIKTGKPKHGESMYDEEGNRLYDNFDTQRQMGEVSNLITDMQIKKASIDEIARAARHSMTVIDAEKHNLDWKASEQDNDIRSLKIKYQGINSRGQVKGASTLISQAKSQVYVDERREGDWVVDPETGKGHRVKYDPNTGERLFQPTGRMYTEYTKRADGTYSSKEVKATQKISKMSNVKDALELSSGQAMEKVYGDHANRLKALANRARKEYMATEAIPFNKQASIHYADEVKSLQAKLDAANAHKPYERRAVALMNSLFQMKLADDPTLGQDSDRKKKERGRLLVYARKVVGKKRPLIKITEREYEAIQAGAIRKTLLEDIIKECDLDQLKQVAMPRQWNGLSTAKLNKAVAMLNNGATQVEVAKTMGVSVTTLQNALKEV